MHVCVASFCACSHDAYDIPIFDMQCTPIYTPRCQRVLFAKFLVPLWDVWYSLPRRPELGVCAHSVHKDRYAQFFLHKDKLAAFQYIYTLHTHTHTTCTHADTHTHTHTQTGHVWPVGCILVPPGLQDGNKASPKNVRTLSVVIACAWVHVQYSTNSWIISIQPVGCTYRIYWQCVCCVYNISLMFKLHGKA